MTEPPFDAGRTLETVLTKPDAKAACLVIVVLLLMLGNLRSRHHRRARDSAFDAVSPPT